MIDTIFSQLCLCFALAVCIPALVFAGEVLAGARAGRITRTIANRGPRAIAVLIPAHDEAAGILDTLRTVLPQLPVGARCIVVADNCTDDTADVAKAAGAEAIERSDPAHRGKGYALDFGLQYLATAPPEVVLMIDADCRIERGGLVALASRCVESGRPVQALYLMQAASDASSMMRIAEFAWRIKNHVRPRGLHRLGLPCQLMGSGMAFPWSALRDVNLATGQIVEDMQLGLDLAERGRAPLFCEEVMVTSRFPTHTEGALAQRTRWEHGHLGIIVNEMPRLLLRAILRRDRLLFALAIDLVVPPLAMLMLFLLASLGLSTVVMVWFTGSSAGIVISAASLLLVSIAVAMGWWTVGREVLSLQDLLLAPWYAFCKVPLYFRFLVKRQAEWVRSKRDPS